MSIRTQESGAYLNESANEPTAETGAGDSFSLIDRFSNFDGTFRSSRDLRIEGEVKGTIECQGTLFVAQGANVTAKVEAENITVAGELNGDINCRGRLKINPSGRLRGKVNTLTLVINEGAFYEGQLEMVDPDSRGSQRTGSPSLQSLPSRPERRNRTAPPTPEAAPAAPTGGGGTTGTSGQAPSGSSSTFIRRFGGPETPWTEENAGSSGPEGSTGE